MEKNESGCLVLGISFLFPIIGFILYFMYKENKPQIASSALKGAMVGILLFFIFFVIPFIIGTCHQQYILERINMP